MGHYNIMSGKAKVLDVTNEGKRLAVTLEKSILYPGGGGQPHDTGKITADGFEGEIVELAREENKVLHYIRPLKGTLKPGQEVHLEVDAARRERIVRMHTGEHIFYKSLENTLPKLRLKKIELGEEESSIFVEAASLTWEELFKAEELANQIISEDRPIVEHIYTKQEAVELGKLRIKPERIKSDRVRVIEIKDFDWSACAGTHASSTGYVRNILITRFNLEKGAYEIRFRTGAQLFGLARIARLASAALDTPTDKVLDSIVQLQKENEILKKKFREASYQALDSYAKEKVNNIDFIYNTVDGVEKKQLTDKMGELLKGRTIVCFASRYPEKAAVMLGSSFDMDVPGVLRGCLEKLGGKGGGRDRFAMGSLPSEKCEEFIKEIRQSISSL